MDTIGVARECVVSIPDAVIIRGANTQVKPEHAGLGFRFQNSVRIEAQALLVSEQLEMTPSSSLTVNSGAQLHISETLDSQVMVTIDGATVTTSRVVSPEVRLINGSVLTSWPSTASQMHKFRGGCLRDYARGCDESD